MVSDAIAEYPARSAMRFLYVDSADEPDHAAIAAGATSLREPQDESQGDRMADVLDRCDQTTTP